MLNEIYTNYLYIIINDNVPQFIKYAICKDCIEISIDIINKINANELFLSEPLKEDFLIKYEFIKNIASELLSGKDISLILPKYLLSEKYLPIKDYIYKIKTEEIQEDEIEQIINLLTIEKQYLYLQKQISNLKNFIDKVETRQFNNINEIIDEATMKVETIYFNLIKHKLTEENLKTSDFIDFTKFDENKDALFDNLKKFYASSVQISTGYSSLDYLFDGGFEKTRIYMFAGRPGVGKSILLLNLFNNLVEKNNDPRRYILFVTLENLTFENILRLLAMRRKQETKTIKNMIRQNNKEILNDLGIYQSGNAKIAYFPSRQLSIGQLFSYIEQINVTNNQVPGAIFIDYLDIMKLPGNFKELRHQLGSITLGLKTLAIKYEIPIITATQLVKNAYNDIPDLSSIKESSEKIDNADVIGLLNRVDNEFQIHIKKNRYAKEGTIKLTPMFEYFLLIDNDNNQQTFYNNNNVNKIESPKLESNNQQKEASYTLYDFETETETENELSLNENTYLL